jgi:predicted DNA binding CopG/RHH family protein
MRAKDAEMQAQMDDIARLSNQLREQQQEIADLKQMNSVMQAAVEKLIGKDTRVVMSN